MVRNLGTVQARLARIPAKVKAAVSRQLKIEAAELASAIKRAAPVDATSDNPGALRDSVHTQTNPRRELSEQVIVDGKDAAGHVFASHVEFGHRTKGGQHVPASPFAHPTLRARRKAMKRRLTATAKKAFQEG